MVNYKINKSHKTALKDVKNYVEQNKIKKILRFVTCGSVDDGKSTLIGRLLYECNAIPEDQLYQLEIDSKRFGSQKNKIDFSLLLDGLVAEREQRITIDVAFRYFETEKRKFIVADAPGHEQYTRNMVSGVSNSDLAIILIDARKGILSQTKRHSFLCNLLGIKNILLAINKMDLIDYKENIFNQIKQDYQDFANQIKISNFTAIPISSLKGDNIFNVSKNTPWYSGSSLISYLENTNTHNTLNISDSFRMPIQWVNRPNSDFRGYSGKVLNGSIQIGSKVVIMPSGKKTVVDKIVTFDGNLRKAFIGQSITLTFKDEIDCSRGQIITDEKNILELADQFEITLIWMYEKSLVPGSTYLLKIGTKTVSARISIPKYEININSLEKLATKTLNFNSIGVATLTTDQPIPYETFKDNKALGSFILIDKLSSATVAAGIINFSLRRSQNIHWQNIDISHHQRSKMKNQKPAVLWLTGLSGSGKSTIANLVDKKLTSLGFHTFLLDGDNLRHGLNKDLGFTEVDRIENIRRAAEVSKLMTEAGLIVISAFITPFFSDRQTIRKIIKPARFIEIYIDTPLEIAEQRDVKGLYLKARTGKLKNFTGIDSRYETPKKPEIRIDTTKLKPEKAMEKIISYFLSLL